MKPLNECWQPTTQDSDLLSAQAARLEEQEGLASQQVPLAFPSQALVQPRPSLSGPMWPNVCLAT